MPRIIRFRDLEPSWTTKQAKEPGFMRWLITWVGGPAGHINTNPGIAVESTQCAVGMMYLPRGQRQAGRFSDGLYSVLSAAVWALPLQPFWRETAGFGQTRGTLSSDFIH